jgi:hypothetical protein
MELSQFAVTDPSWFYSSIAQSTAALVGFVGGFYIFRLQTYLSEWAAATRSLEALQQRWATLFWGASEMSGV